MDLDMIDMQPGGDLMADQTRRNPVGVAPDSDRAPDADRYLVLSIVIEAVGRKRLQDRQLCLQALSAVPVPRGEDVPQKAVIRSTTGKIAAAAQQQSLVDSFLDSVVG